MGLTGVERANGERRSQDARNVNKQATNSRERHSGIYFSSGGQGLTAATLCK